MNNTESTTKLYGYVNVDGGYIPACDRCGGLGRYAYNSLTGDTHCYKCTGRGYNTDKRFTRDEALARTARLEKARARREAKAQAEWQAELENTREARKAEAAEIAAYQAELATWTHLDVNVGDAVTVTGTVEALVDVQGNYGDSRLVVIETPEKQSVNMFTTAIWAYNVERGQSVTIKGTVKGKGEYNGKAQTTLTRPSLQS